MWEILAEMDPGLFDFKANVNVDLIRMTFANWEIQVGDQPEMMAKIMTYVGAYKEYVASKMGKP